MRGPPAFSHPKGSGTRPEEGLGEPEQHGGDDALVAGAVQQALLHLRASRRECAEELRRDAVAEDHAAGDPH